MNDQFADNFLQNLEHEFTGGNITIVISPDKDERAKNHVGGAVQWVQENRGTKNLTDAQLTHIYTTQHHPIFSDVPRYQLFTEKGENEHITDTIDPSALKHLKDIREQNFNNPEQKASLGQLCDTGELCFGQAIFESVVLDQLGVQNEVILLLSKKDRNLGHAVVHYKEKDGKNYLADPMQGPIYPFEELNLRYDWLQGLEYFSILKYPTQKVKMRL